MSNIELDCVSYEANGDVLECKSNVLVELVVPEEQLGQYTTRGWWIETVSAGKYKIFCKRLDVEALSVAVTELYRQHRQ